jgi:tetratricopeptide (TPR) repeat protein
MKMSLYFFTLLVCAIGLSSSCESKKETVKPESGNIDTLLMKHPDSLPILIRHGQFYFDKRNFEKASESATKAFRLDSNNVEVRMLYALVLNNSPTRTIADVLRSQRHYDFIIKKEPRNTAALIGIASTYSMLREFDKSFQYINEALRIDKKYRDAYILKGTNYREMNNMPLAKSSYETATQQDPSFYEAYIALGDMYLSENNPIAIQYYTTATQIVPDDVGVLYKLAFAYQALKRFDEAAQTYRDMFQKDETFAMSLFQQGYMKHINLNEIDSAMIFYKQALVIEPRFVEAWHNLGLCYESKGDKAQALQSYSRALKLNPNFEKSRLAAEALR